MVIGSLEAELETAGEEGPRRQQVLPIPEAGAAGTGPDPGYRSGRAGDLDAPALAGDAEVQPQVRENA